MPKTLLVQIKGGAGSGNYGHAGRPGLIGGSGGGMRSGIMPGSAAATDVESDKFRKLFDNVSGGRDCMGASDSLRSELKVNIISDLSEQSGLDVDVIDTALKSWAIHSNDDDATALSLQQAAAEEFGVQLSAWQEGKLANVEGESALQRSEETQILRSMYDSTQAFLAGQGLKPGDTVTMFRGHKIHSKEFSTVREGDNIEYSGNAMESWSVMRSVARKFAYVAYASHTTLTEDPGLIVAMEVPVENIVGSAATGFGCLTEGEFVILGSIPGQSVRVLDVWPK